MNGKDIRKYLIISGAVAGLVSGSQLRAAQSARDLALSQLRSADGKSPVSSTVKVDDTKDKNGCGKNGCGGKDSCQAAAEKHICKGHNTCKGLGSCKTDKHDCAGKNDCKGQGGCASAEAKHACKGQNACKGLGGCKTEKNDCAGKNDCKGQGGCKVPVEHAEEAPAK
jgi:hypothetical protein